MWVYIEVMYTCIDTKSIADFSLLSYNIFMEFIRLTKKGAEIILACKGRNKGK